MDLDQWHFLYELTEKNREKVTFYEKNFTFNQLKREAIRRNLRLGSYDGGRYTKDDLIGLLIENDIYYSGPFGMSEKFSAVKEGKITHLKLDLSSRLKTS